jgi:hypothetical protein
MYPPQKFMMATFGEVPRAVIPPSRSAMSTPIYHPARSRSLSLPSLNLWRAERVPRTMMTTTSDGSYDHPLSYSDQGRVWG